MVVALLVTLIGFWRSERTPGWPDPVDFIDEDWDLSERQQVSDYLDHGGVQVPWMQMGWSWCRICSTEDGDEPYSSNGTGEFSDGVYLWPEGLSHYVRDHSVRLPRDIVTHMCGAHGCVEDLATLRHTDVNELSWHYAAPDWIDTPGIVKHCACLRRPSPTARVCPACGLPRPRYCVKCGSPLPLGSHTCANCGQPRANTDADETERTDMP